MKPNIENTSSNGSSVEEDDSESKVASIKCENDGIDGGGGEGEEGGGGGGGGSGDGGGCDSSAKNISNGCNPGLSPGSTKPYEKKRTANLENLIGNLKVHFFRYFYCQIK